VPTRAIAQSGDIVEIQKALPEVAGLQAFDRGRIQRSRTLGLELKTKLSSSRLKLMRARTEVAMRHAERAGVID
jgi:hypothetical protein